jgi:hypothetical protein
MIACESCHSAIHEASRFCPVCGRPRTPAAQFAAPAVPAQPYQEIRPGQLTAANGIQPHHGGFVQHFGLDPRIALLTVIVDSMLFGGQVLTLGSTMMLSIPAGIALGVITYKAQRHWYGDDRDSALIKALITGLLTAIPTSLPGFLTIPSGLVGLLHFFPGKRRNPPMLLDPRVPR